MGSGARSEMNHDVQLSRPARLAAGLGAGSEREAVQTFSNKRILVRIEEEFAANGDAKETFRLAINQILRFCPNVAVAVPAASHELIGEANLLKREIYESTEDIPTVSAERDFFKFDAIVNVGVRVDQDLPWIGINSSGWLARVATWRSQMMYLPWTPAVPNPCGAHAAACLGSGLAFLTILGKEPAVAREMSLLTHEEGNLGSLDSGTALPRQSLEIDAFVVGCGAVTNGWAYTTKTLPIVGKVQAVDRQSLKIENIGPYVLAKHSLLNRPKVTIIEGYLAPQIKVTPRPEEWELFKIRLKFGLVVPSIVVNGLDNVLTRHSVQRLWPATLIDMAAGGLNSQIIVKKQQTEAICLLQALQVPTDEIDWAERLAQQIGVSAERIRNEPTSEITQADIDATDSSHRSKLRSGTQICGRITEQNLTMEGYDPDFAPAVPFVTCFSGVVGAAETMKYLMGISGSFHYQRNFLSSRGRALQMKCNSSCECRREQGRFALLTGSTTEVSDAKQ